MQNSSSNLFGGIVAAQTVNCLLVDDNPNDAEMFRFALRRAGLLTSLTVKTTGAEAIEMLSVSADPRPDIIFLGLDVPVINGKECLRRFRNLPRLDEVPVIIYSASTDLAEIRETKSLGASHFLSKTTTPDDLAEILQYLFYRKNLPYWLNITLDHYE